jgi:hypothetical protein
LRGQLLQHPGHGSGADAQMAGESGAGYPFLLRAAQFQDGFQVIVDGFGIARSK